MGSKKAHVRRFTDSLVRKIATPLRGRVEIYDSIVPQFGVRVTAKGSRTYFLRAVWPDGRNTKRMIAHCNKIECEEARRIARGWLTLLSFGIDPIEEEMKMRVASAKTPPSKKLRAAFWLAAWFATGALHLWSPHLLDRVT